VTITQIVNNTNDVEARANSAIEAAKLRRRDHPFLLAAQDAEAISLADALAMCCQFQAMTRMFMFTTISGLGVIARGLARGTQSDRDELAMFQTAYCVIGDDLANLAPAFGEVAPAGPAGIHYLWWQDSFREPIAACLTQQERDRAALIPPELGELLDNMDRLAVHPLGCAVQLRVVEAIAKDVAVALRRVLAKVTVGGRPLFSRADMTWLDAHIRAETMHAKQVSDEDSGMSLVVKSEAEGELFVELVAEYATNWSRALNVYTPYIRTRSMAGNGA
jgi:hypothetical protein